MKRNYTTTIIAFAVLFISESLSLSACASNTVATSPSEQTEETTLCAEVITTESSQEDTKEETNII